MQPQTRSPASRGWRAAALALAMLAAAPLGALEFLTPDEADATRVTNEGQAARPWDLWREQARRAEQNR